MKVYFLSSRYNESNGSSHLPHYYLLYGSIYYCLQHVFKFSSIELITILLELKE